MPQKCAARAGGASELVLPRVRRAVMPRAPPHAAFATWHGAAAAAAWLPAGPQPDRMQRFVRRGAVAGPRLSRRSARVFDACGYGWSGSAVVAALCGMLASHNNDTW